MIGEIYKLEQGSTSIMTMFDHNRYIVLEEGEGLKRFYIFTQQNIIGSHKPASEFNNRSIFYKLVHFIVPSVSTRSRDSRVSNIRSIDREIKEFFAIKNIAHLEFENDNLKNLTNETTNRNLTD